jgi:CHAT domain-containing protein
MVRMDVDEAELAQLVRIAIGSYRRTAGSGEHRAPPEAETARDLLARRLIDPVPGEFWTGAERLIIVPDGVLHYLPFELLPAIPGGPTLLTERYSIAYTPSFTALQHLRVQWRAPAAGSGREFLGFGDPEFATGSGAAHQEPEGEAQRRLASRGRALQRLPYSRVELENIARTVGAGAASYLGPDATEHRVKSECAGYRYVHFATHGLLDDENPLYSGLALAPPRPEERAGSDDPLDDMLQVWEMFGLRLSAELVVCSACDTGRGRIHAGEGLVGMSRALFFAGARCVIVSLWPVPDAATSRIMTELYRQLGAGRPVVDALRAAKAAEREQSDDAYFWAAFVAVGLGW